MILKLVGIRKNRNDLSSPKDAQHTTKKEEKWTTYIPNLPT